MRYLLGIGIVQYTAQVVRLDRPRERAIQLGNHPGVRALDIA